VPAIVTSGGRIVLDPAVTVRGNASAAITGPAFVDTVPVPFANVQVQSSLLNASILGEPATLTAALLSWVVPPLPTPFGTLWVNECSRLADFGVMPASGVRSFQFPVPPLAAPAPVVVQPASLRADGRLVLGAPDLFTTR
jgi:hypothetical protein